MTTTILQQVKSILVCTICNNIVDNPRTLPCSHTFCRRCIEQKLSKTNPPLFQCPSCNRFSASFKDIDALPVDPIDTQLIQLYSQSFSLSLSLSLSSICTWTSSSIDSIQQLTPCSNCEKTVDVQWCIRCEAPYCPECFSSVHKPIPLQKHTQIPINQKPTEMVYCDIHKGKENEFWCHTCNKTLCSTCVLSKHRDHQYDSIDEFAMQFKNKVRSHH